MPRQYKLARKMKKIALTAAAKEMGISQSTLSGWESERTVPSIEGLERMADYYRVSTDFLLGRDTQADPRPDWLQPLDPKALPAFHETPSVCMGQGLGFCRCGRKAFALCRRRNTSHVGRAECFLSSADLCVTDNSFNCSFAERGTFSI